jgi:hypothetical protein
MASGASFSDPFVLFVSFVVNGTPMPLPIAIASDTRRRLFGEGLAKPQAGLRAVVVALAWRLLR